jgi:hypothetical protein
MKHLILALLAATFSLSVMAGKPTKEQIVEPPAETAIIKSKSNITNNRETALMGADSCNFAIDQKGNKFTIDEKGVRRPTTEQQQKTCKTFNESRSNALREGNPSSGRPRSGEVGIAVSDPGVASDKNATKK